MPTRLLSWRFMLARVALIVVSGGLLVCSACASSAASHAPYTTVSPSAPPPKATIAPTATLPGGVASTTCADATPGPGSMGTFPVPAGTISTGPNGAAGAGFWYECTVGETASSLASYLNTALPQAGWQPWNAQTQNANGCGTEPNDYWKWYRGNSAVGYTITQSGVPRLPVWLLVFCSLAYGR